MRLWVPLSGPHRVVTACSKDNPESLANGAAKAASKALGIRNLYFVTAILATVLIEHLAEIIAERTSTAEQKTNELRASLESRLTGWASKLRRK